ncbi:MAG: DNA polymerase III subunit chi [Neisseriaceae bacterium]|nr:DNA polymerase III subunit chi [Neisseriaceae bacterium]MBO7554627.1 DNA polymerase III subunit chi [Neisseriaceae bacterium]
MPQTVSFYTHISDIPSFICRLLRTVYDKHTDIAVRCATLEQCQWLDQQLWLFDANSFLAHDVWADNPNSTAPIVLFSPNDDTTPCRITTVLNLSEQPCLEPYLTRVVEIVSNDETALANARQRFRLYKDAGFVIDHKKMQ